MKRSAPIWIVALLVPWILAGTVGDGYSADKSAQSLEIRPRPPRDFWVTVDTDRSVYGVGDAVQVRFRASADCYVYIFNTDSYGLTRQIFPNYYDRDNVLRGNRRYTIPMGRYHLVTTGPPGRESLRIMAYRRPWRVLEPWNEFRSGDPFPRRSVAPDEMRKQVEAEARAAQEDTPKARPDRDEHGRRIIPVPPPRPYLDYAEDWAEFRVEAPRYYPDPW